MNLAAVLRVARRCDIAALLKAFDPDQPRDDTGRWSDGGSIPMNVDHRAHMGAHLRVSNKLMQMSRDADAAGDNEKARALRSQSHQRHAMAMAHQDAMLAAAREQETNRRRAETRARNAAGKVSLTGLLRKYRDDQPRDEQGRWSADGGGSGKPSIEQLFSDSLGYERANMPQVPAKFRGQFISDLRDAGISVSNETVDARSLKPTQRDYKAANVEHLRAEDAAGNWGSGDRGRIMVSREGRVLDGHHRWAFKAQDDQKIEIVRVNTPISDLLNRAMIFNTTHGIERRTTKLFLVASLQKYSEDQPRDELGRWSAEGGGGAPPELTTAQVVPKGLRDAVAALVAEHAGHEADMAASLTQEQKEQAAKELASSIKGANEDKPGFDTRLHEIAKDVNGTPKTAPVKGGARLLEKHVLENASDPAQMRDLVRGSIIVNSPAEAAQALDRIKSEYKVTRIKDRFAQPLPTGYSDMLINVELPSGIQGEIQLHVPEMIAAKGLGHSVYNIERSTPPGAEKSAMVQLQSQIYGSAVKANRERTRQQQGG